MLEEALDQMPNCAGVLGAADLAAVEAASEVIAELAGRASPAFVHGDFQPRNWLWAEGGSRLTVIDFESSGAASGRSGTAYGESARPVAHFEAVVG